MLQLCNTILWTEAVKESVKKIYGVTECDRKWVCRVEYPVFFVFNWAQRWEKNPKIFPIAYPGSIDFLNTTRLIAILTYGYAFISITSSKVEVFGIPIERNLTSVDWSRLFSTIIFFFSTIPIFQTLNIHKFFKNSKYWLASGLEKTNFAHFISVNNVRKIRFFWVFPYTLMKFLKREKM